jgi:hypothetical protein
MFESGQPHGSEGNAMRRVLVIGVAALVAAAASAPAGAKLSKKAYFDVEIAATQQVKWTKDTEFHMCGDGIGTQGGEGSADLTFDIGPKHWVEAKRVPGPSVAMLQFDGNIGPVRAYGTLTRQGHLEGMTTKQPTGYCPKPGPPQDDCGTLGLPADATLGMAYISPGTWSSWRYPGHPKSMSLVMNGPASPTWAGAPFKFCPGVTGDDILGGTWAPYIGSGTPAYAGPASLPLSLVFGKKKHFKIHWHDTLKDDPFAPMTTLPDPYITAKFPIETSVDWTVRFDRRAHPPGSR